jgi:hypothetical protein
MYPAPLRTILGPGSLGGGRDGDVVLGGELQEVLTATIIVSETCRMTRDYQKAYAKRLKNSGILQGAITVRLW